MSRLAALFAICVVLPRLAEAQVSASVVNFERLGVESKTGKTTFEPLRALREKRSAELEVAARPLQDPKLGDRERERVRVLAQRFAEDAEREVTTLQQTLETEFERKVRAAIAQVLTARGPSVVLAVPQPAVLWFSPEADITDAVIHQLDGPAAAPTKPPQ